MKRDLLTAPFVLLLLSVALAAQGGNAKDGRSSVINSILGVRLGASLEETQELLKPLGTMGGRGTRDGGRKEAWTLKGTDFASITYQTTGKGRVKWVMAFLRPGKEIPFEKLGDLKFATLRNQTDVVWSFEDPQGNYRVAARGAEGRARVIYLMLVPSPPMQ